MCFCAVPDDWCAPLGCETGTKKDEVACPSVRLRTLSIPLWNIPIIKQEVCSPRPCLNYFAWLLIGNINTNVCFFQTGTYHIDPHQQIKVIRKSKRGEFFFLSFIFCCCKYLAFSDCLSLLSFTFIFTHSFFMTSKAHFINNIVVKYSSSSLELQQRSLTIKKSQ